MLDTEKISALISKKRGRAPKITYYKLTDSTNLRAKDYATANPDDREPRVFIADGQTAGRGRLGRSFVSESCAGIYVSLLLHPEASGFDATRVTAKAAVALSLATEQLTGAKTHVKWVNDIFLGSKKLAGIWVEGSMCEDGNLPYIVVGMGINVYKNAISEEISDIATSIEGETKMRVDRSELAALIIPEFFRGCERGRSIS